MYIPNELQYSNNKQDNEPGIHLTSPNSHRQGNQMPLLFFVFAQPV